MDIKNNIALVSGANRGLGLALVQELLDHGATKIYAATRKPYDFGDPRIVNIHLDLTDSDSIKKLAAAAKDTSIVINNAGAFLNMGVLNANLENARIEFETNVFGPMQISQVMAPVLKKSGGALVNIISVGSWLPFGAYGASKAALWSLTNTLRQELQPQGTRVVGVHVGPMDTDMVRDLDLPKMDPSDVARIIIEGLENGKVEILVDDFSKHAKTLLSGPVEALTLAA